MRLTEVRIPNHTVRNSTARLECHYDMDGEELYSVKWYKDGHEFYRYIPRSMPPALVFELPGINVDVSGTRLQTNTDTHIANKTKKKRHAHSVFVYGLCHIKVGFIPYISNVHIFLHQSNVWLAFD